MEMLISFVALAALSIAAFKGMKWMSKAGQINARKEMPLTPTDLKVLEESAARLMADLRLTTDECVSRMESACQAAEQAVMRLESSKRELESGGLSPTSSCPSQNGAQPQWPQSFLDPAQSPAEVAKLTGSTTGEIELIRGLRAISCE